MARIGMVNYINTAPIYAIWKAQVHQPDWLVTEAPPVRLNRLLAAGALDLGFASAYEYAARPKLYRLLADLSISATGPVGSVFLFSSVPPEQLDGKLVLLTGQSDTSAHLLKLMLEEFLWVKPQYIRGEVFAARAPSEEPAAMLAIGDEALRLAARKGGRYPIRIDLGEYWHRQTGLPFVFAVCAVREDFLHNNLVAAQAIHKTLLNCRRQGLARLPEICAATAPCIPMSEEACLQYFQSIEYDLGPAKQQALTKFFELLIRRGEADPAALPLKLFP
ncbi:menaquinone biosynthetic enzyme MqnA/MqnD family protein [Candidatus Electronema sp. PJ]|uniref:menaquinone biosynthetic enzyme MqnA/MqnD family protein n=1 Tax=Candidatus Electronema sp. PJ TaxID=3401572 RepID=UPI003AA7AE71